MKKILLASSAIVAFGGAAAADVALTGRAEMGIFKTSAADAQFFTDIDVTFTMSGETDNGLTFGASVDLDEGGNQPATNDDSDDGGATIFISGGFGTVTMGDTDGALDWALTDAGNVGNPGSLADDETSHAGYLGNWLDGTQDGQILRYDYSSGAFGVAVSLEDDNGSSATNAQVGFALGFKYALDLSGTTVNFGIGYQEAAGTPATGQTENGEALAVSVSATFANGLSAGLTYTDMDNLANDKHVGIGVGYTTGAFTVHANYGKFDGVAANSDSSGIGISAAYDLGGGAVVHAGYSRDDVDGSAFDFQRASLGLALSF